jgi:hypothetical protein
LFDDKLSSSVGLPNGGAVASNRDGACFDTHSANMKNRFRNPRLALAALMVCGTAFAQQTQIVTLRDFNSNNTSAAAAANGSSGGASNFNFGVVSKVPMRALLGASGTRIYAHLMPWFGSRGHINVGYDSANAEQIHRQVEDMVSRGIDGVIAYWTGASGSGNSAHTNEVALKLRKEAERHPGFQFAIQEDKQALEECAKRGCDLTGELAADLQYAAKTFFNSPAYMTMNGRPTETASTGIVSGPRCRRTRSLCSAIR